MGYSTTVQTMPAPVCALMPKRIMSDYRNTRQYYYRTQPSRCCGDFSLKQEVNYDLKRKNF